MANEKAEPALLTSDSDQPAANQRHAASSPRLPLYRLKLRAGSKSLRQVGKEKSTEKQPWNASFAVVASRANARMSHFYREYFDKPARETPWHYRTVYKNQGSELGAMVPANEHRNRRLQFSKPYKLSHTIKALHSRAPPFPSQAFPSVHEHMLRIREWDAATRLRSHDNRDRPKARREYFDTAVGDEPFKVYEKITPVRDPVGSI